MANGLEAEVALMQGLQQRGFVLAELSDEDKAHLDEALKVDGVILRPPQASTCFFPAPIAGGLGQPEVVGTLVTFRDGGQDDTTRWRKMAMKVRLQGG